MQALLQQPEDDGQQVDGEAFFITDGNSVSVLDFQRLIWYAAGDMTAPEEVTVVPAWFMLILATAVEWLYWVCTMGLKRP